MYAKEKPHALTLGLFELYYVLSSINKLPHIHLTFLYATLARACPIHFLSSEPEPALNFSSHTRDASVDSSQ